MGPKVHASRPGDAIRDNLGMQNTRYILFDSTGHKDANSSFQQAANYLDIKPLLDIGCKTVANMIKGKSPEEIRKTFNIQNDFTPEEEDQIRRENEWAEE